ncbi:MAG: hypothetical protein AB7P02_12620 [Alphaproteobacteria bacterium]
MTVRLLRLHPSHLLHLACRKCPRRGRYGRERLLERYGPDVDLVDLLAAISADCPRRQATAGIDHCGAHYVDPGPAPVGVTPLRPMTAAELIADLRRHAPSLPVVIETAAIPRGARYAALGGVRVASLATDPPRVARDGAPHLVLFAISR